MDKLLEKYPKLQSLNFGVLLLSASETNLGKDEIYSDYKKALSHIGLDPSEYEQCIKWFCDTMDY